MSLGPRVRDAMSVCPGTRDRTAVENTLSMSFIRGTQVPSTSLGTDRWLAAKSGDTTGQEPISVNFP